MKTNSVSRVSLLLAALVLSACGSSVRLSEVPVEDRSGATAGRAADGSVGAGAGAGAGSGAVGSGAGSAASALANRTVVPADQPSSRAGQAGAAGAAGASSGSAGTGSTLGGGMAAVPSNLQRTVVYFDFDSFDLKPEGLAIVDSHARFLNANKGRALVVEGHADERGGREYNLALGQKRAEAVRRRLALQGVPDGQVEAVSFGEEKPAVAGSDEAAHDKNRRAEIKYR